MLPAHNAMLTRLLNSYPEVRDYLEKGQPDKALTVLRAKYIEHENDPDYFYLSGILALKANDYTGAASAFERVVLMQPDNAGAWLDLGIANAEAGNAATALGYFDYIESQFSPPDAVRRLITRYRVLIATQPKTSPWQFYVQAMGGVDSNANSGLLNSTVPVTLGGERLDLLLDPAYQARSDNFAQLDAGARYKRQIGENQAELVMGLRQRAYQREHDFSTLDLSVSGGLRRPTSIGDIAFWLHLEHLRLGGNSLLNNVRAVAQIEHPFESCRFGLGTEAEWRRYISASTLDANVLWGQAGVACDWHIATLPVQSTFIGRIGLDTPTADRPGGSAKRGEWIAQFGVPLPKNARVELSFAYATARDNDGYSPLLENNAARRLDRRNIRLLLTMPVANLAEVILLVDDNRFTSNLTLFQQNGQSVSVGLRRRF